MDELERLRRITESMVEKFENSNTPEAADMMEKTTQTLKLIAELEQSRAEASKLAAEESKLRYDLDHAPQHDRSEQIKQYVSLLTPVLTTAILAGTLILQGYQFTQSEKDKREAAEDAQWTDAVKTISQSTKLAPPAVILNPFLKSEHYGNRARMVAIQLMSESDDPKLFADLFQSAFQPLAWENLPVVLDLDRTLQQSLSQVAPLKVRNALEESKYNYTLAAIKEIGTAIAPLLRAPRLNNASLPLQGTYFIDCDWKRTNLTGTNLTNTWFIRVNLEGADLSGVTEFKGAYFGTAWWDASRIAPELLEYVLKQNPYDSLDTYALQGASREHYAAAITRLKQSSEHR